MLEILKNLFRVDDWDSKLPIIYRISEILDIIAFTLMSFSILYTLTKYRKCSYDKISLCVLIIFWMRYLFRFIISICSISLD
jgi:hypothetical protein